jgi:hypothetical protein
MRLQKLIILDECLLIPPVWKDYPIIRFKKGTLDKEIIKTIRSFENPVILYTQNTKDFNKKLKKCDEVKNFSKDIIKRKDLGEAISADLAKSIRSTKRRTYQKYTTSTVQYDNKFTKRGTRT